MRPMAHFFLSIIRIEVEDLLYFEKNEIYSEKILILKENIDSLKEKNTILENQAK